MGGLTITISIGRARLNTLTLLGIAITSVIAITLLGASHANAQSADREGVAMTPASSKIELDAGGVREGKITVINIGSTAYDLTVYARPFSINGNDYTKKDFTSQKENADLYKWIRFAKTTYKLAANGSVDVKYTINAPKGAAPGGHYGVIFAEVQSTLQNPNSNSIIRKKRVGSLVYATVNGQLDLKGNVGEGHIPFWQVEPPMHATVAASNSGNTHFEDTVQMTVRDIFGRDRYRASKQFLVLPDSTRTMEMKWDKAPWFGIYKIEMTQKFLGKTYTSDGYVLMMPRYIILLVAFILVGGAAYFYVQRKIRK